MSAVVLRKAAALMWERAEAVRAGADEPDMWFGAEEIVDEFMWGDQPQHGDVKADAEHIASWHPAVALAVADWLDATARELDSLGDPDLSSHPQDGRRTAALAVARAYLGDDR